jgi:antitoxin PrlF
MNSTITSKGQTTIPKEVRAFLRLNPGDKVKFFFHPDGHVAILPVLPVSRLKGILSSPKRAASIEEMDAGIAKAVAGRFRRAPSK